MGWYVICSICGEEGKYGTNCDCYAKQTIKNAELMKDCKILDSFVVSDYPMIFLIQKLSSPYLTILYFRICLQDGGDEWSYLQRIKQIEEEEYNKCKDSKETDKA